MAYLYRPFTIDNILIVVDDAVVLYSFDVEVFFLFSPLPINSASMMCICTPSVVSDTEKERG